ncbi:MAG: potassium channel protein [Alphaproteobacteria bacterium]|nr:potassium channel protein [Alphaproteobacteria bacterium]
MKGVRQDQQFARSAGRLWVAFTLVMLVVVVGTTGFHLLGRGRWSWFDALYMTVITISTVGYGETLSDMADVPWARPWTLALILSGTGALLYFVSMLTALVVEGDLRGLMERRRMNTRIDACTDHVIVCGCGTTGRHVIGELIATRTPYVAIDSDTERLAELSDEYGEDFVHIEGDATDDAVLREAGVTRARGVLTALRDDRDNLFVTISARSLNDRLRIVARAVEGSAERKLRRAGADAIVSPNFIGGMRLASEMIRPSVVQFLDVMLRDRDRGIRIESVTLPAGTALQGRTLRESRIRERTELLVIAVAEADGSYVFNPGAEHRLAAGQTLVVMGDADDVDRLRGIL